MARPGPRLIDVFTYGGQAPRPTPPEFVAYPPDGMTGAALTYQGAETSAAFPGAHYPVGSAITLKYTGAGALALSQRRLTGPDGAALPTLTHANYNFITHNVIALAAGARCARPAATACAWTGPRTVRLSRGPGASPPSPRARRRAAPVPTGGPPPVPTGARAPLATPTPVATAAPAGPDLRARFAALWSRTRRAAGGYRPRDPLLGLGAGSARHARWSPTRGPGGQRQVQYYDKAAWRSTTPAAAPTDPWYVTNGLLVARWSAGRCRWAMARSWRAPAARSRWRAIPRPANPDAPSYAAMRGVASVTGDHTAPDMHAAPGDRHVDPRRRGRARALAGGYGVRLRAMRPRPGTISPTASGPT